MKRRGFIVMLAGGFLFATGNCPAVCNSLLVQVFEGGRQLVQTRPGRKGLALGDYFIQWYGQSSFLIYSGS